METYCVYDYEQLFKLDDLDIKKVTLDLVENTVVSAMEEQKWDTKSFKNACNLVRKNNYQNNWVWKKKTNKGMFAEVRVEHDVRKARIFLSIKKSNGKIIKEHLIAETIPIEFVFFSYFGELKWINDNCVMLKTKNGEVYTTDIKN